MKNLPLWKQIGLMLIISILVFSLTILSLKWFTRHNQSYVAPDLTGLTLDHLKKLEKDYDFKFIVIDSVYDKDFQPGTVIRHDPAANSTVKKGRKFYLTMASFAPGEVAMPNLVDFSLRQAISILESSGLNIGEITYEPDFSQNAVIGQLYNGKTIEPGKIIRKGSIIDLVVSGSGGVSEISNTDMEQSDTTDTEQEYIPDEI